jgi:hypothetical protein
MILLWWGRFLGQAALRGGVMTRHKRAFWIGVLALLMAAAVMPYVQAAPGGAVVTTSPQSGPVGTVFELNGTGFPVLSTGEVTIDGISLGQLSSDETGAIRGFFMVPEMRAGPAKVRVVFANVRAQTTFNVTPG